MSPEFPEFVFTFNGKGIQRINGKAWRNAKSRAGVTQCRVHDLRHTFAGRLRAAGVGIEDREDLLGHSSQRMTTHYSQAEIENLRTAIEKLCTSKRNNFGAIYFRDHAKAL